MTEHIPLTAQEVAAMEARATATTGGKWHVGPYGITTWFVVGPKARAAAEFIAAAKPDLPRLIADWKELRQLLHALTADETAGIHEGGIIVRCTYCRVSMLIDKVYTHAPDCPIARGRALVAKQELEP